MPAALVAVGMLALLLIAGSLFPEARASGTGATYALVIANGRAVRVAVVVVSNGGNAGRSDRLDRHRRGRGHGAEYSAPGVTSPAPRVATWLILQALFFMLVAPLWLALAAAWRTVLGARAPGAWCLDVPSPVRSTPAVSTPARQHPSTQHFAPSTIAPSTRPALRYPLKRREMRRNHAATPSSVRSRRGSGARHRQHPRRRLGRHHPRRSSGTVRRGTVDGAQVLRASARDATRPGLSARVTAVADGRQIEAVATAGQPGYYSASVVLPRAATWTITHSQRIWRKRLATDADRGSSCIEPAPPVPEAQRGLALFVAKGRNSCRYHTATRAQPSRACGEDLSNKNYSDALLSKMLTDPSMLPKKDIWEMPNLQLKPQEVSALVAFINKPRTKP